MRPPPRQSTPRPCPLRRHRRLTALVRANVEAGSEAAKADSDLLARLGDVRAAGADAEDNPLNSHGHDASIIDATYASVFRSAGLDVDSLGPVAVAARIRSRPSPIALAIAAAIDDWASHRRTVRPNAANARRNLATAARLADPDPKRSELRSLWAEEDRGTQLDRLRAMAGMPDVETWPMPTLNLLASTIAAADDIKAAVALARRAVMQHPEDLATNFNLARLLEKMSYTNEIGEEIIRCYSAMAGAAPMSSPIGLAIR